MVSLGIVVTRLTWRSYFGKFNSAAELQQRGTETLLEGRGAALIDSTPQTS